jgi:hypothetical protein
LPIRNKGLVNPLGEWAGWYFSEEIKAAIEANVGYDITYLKGIKFERGSPFTKYVNAFL